MDFISFLTSSTDGSVGMIRLQRVSYRITESLFNSILDFANFIEVGGQASRKNAAFMR
jgi:hypothetical protein